MKRFALLIMLLLPYAALMPLYAQEGGLRATPIATLDVLPIYAQPGKNYLYSGGARPPQIPLANATLKTIEARVETALKNLHGQALVDDAGDFGHFYMRARHDCTTLATAINHAFSMGEYDGWKLIAKYDITAYPAQGQQYLFTSGGGRNFEDPQTGRQYIAWVYHRAALLVLRKGNDTAFVTADPLLLKRPAQFAAWAALLHPATRYILRRNDNGAPPTGLTSIKTARKNAAELYPYID